MDLTALRIAHPGHWSKATAIRALTLDAVATANSGHSGMPMGMADVATVLFEKHLKFDASTPRWSDRDRFILSRRPWIYAALFNPAPNRLSRYDFRAD